MLDDHEILSSARNHLADALKALLKAGIMDARDFAVSRNAVVAALGDLDALLRQPHRDEAQP